MSDSHSAVVIAALANAATSVPVKQGPVQAGHLTPAAARACASEELRNAQVELYCDHRSNAFGAIRRAKHALADIGSPSAFVGLAELEQATWHARNNDTTAAVDVLSGAKQRLDH